VLLTDLDTAGYFLHSGLSLAYAVRLDRVHFEFEFYDPDGRAETLALEFINSSEHGFADAVCRLKKVIHRFSGKRRGNSNGQQRIPLDAPPTNGTP